MRRRDFIALLGGTAAACSEAWPLAWAQQSAAPVVGVLVAGSPSGFWAEMFTVFRQGLADAGYSEGRNVTIEARWAEDHYDRLPALAAELIGRRPAVSLLGVEVGPKLLELLHEAVPSATTGALLVNPTNPNATNQSKMLQAAAARLGLQLHMLNAANPGDFEPAFAKLSDLQVAALMIVQDVLFNTEVEQLGKLAVLYKIPAIYVTRSFAAAGGLMAYAANYRDGYRQVGIYTGRILKGEKPSDLPVIQAVKFDLVINLKTAKALGLNLPLPLLGRADEVIE